nr:hypothetical protein [Providencia heimbachae]
MSIFQWELRPTDNDEKVKSLIKELDILSSQIEQEEDKRYTRRYSDHSRGYSNHSRCWWYTYF